MKEQYLMFNRCSDKVVQIWSINENENIGKLEYMQIGEWFSWCLFLNLNCYLSASCQDEVREITRKLNANKYAFVNTP